MTRSYRDHLDQVLQDADEAMAYLTHAADESQGKSVYDLALLGVIRALHRKVDALAAKLAEHELLDDHKRFQR